MLENFLSGTKSSFDETMLDRSTSNQFTVTVKNYEMGLSKQIHSLDNTYEVQGPMGKGLDI